MNPQVYIKEKQKFWAKSNNIDLDENRLNAGYTKTKEMNLFCKLSAETTDSFINADGNEFGDQKSPGKVQALHSSSALALNIFEYWKNNDYEIIAKSLRIPSKNISHLSFEQKFKISDNFDKAPNIDVLFKYSTSYTSAIECKFTEPYRYNHSGLKDKYINSDLWSNIPEIYKFAKQLCPDDNHFKYLHAAQLIKHILGLLSASNGDKSKFRLVYLWYHVFGKDGYLHQEEINEIKETFDKDSINFQSITYQDVILNLIKNSNANDFEYLKYITRRYL